MSKESWVLYRAYLRHSPLLICPCYIKKYFPLVVEECQDNGTTLLRLKNRDHLTIAHIQDLEVIGELSDELSDLSIKP